MCPKAVLSPAKVIVVKGLPGERGNFDPARQFGDVKWVSAVPYYGHVFFIYAGGTRDKYGILILLFPTKYHWRHTIGYHHLLQSQNSHIGSPLGILRAQACVKPFMLQAPKLLHAASVTKARRSFKLIVTSVVKMHETW